MVAVTKAKRMTAKKSDGNGSDRPEKEKRKVPKWPNDPVKMLGILAADLHAHAELLEKAIELWPELGEPSANILAGNFYLAMSQLRDSFQGQVLGKFQGNLAPLTSSKQATFSRLMMLAAQLEEAMPDRSEKGERE